MHNYTRKAYLNIPRFLWDGVFVAATFPLAVWACHAIQVHLAWVNLLWVPMLYALVFLYSMNNKGLYDAATFTYQDRTLRGVTASCLSASALCMMFLFFLPQSIGNTDFLAFFSIGGVVLLGLRYFMVLSISQHAGSRASSQMLLAGDPRQMREYLFYLDKTGFRVTPVGFLSENPADTVRDLPRLGSPSDLKTVLQKRVVDEVVLAWPQNCGNHVSPLLRECTRRGLLVKVALDVGDADGAKCLVHSVGPVPVLIYHRTNLSSMQQSIKRAIDLIVGLAGVLAALLLAAFIVPAILLDSKGPALVLLPRLGLHGRPFFQLRFRTTKAEMNPASRRPEDRTRVGRFLFRTKLHYLPSFLNVVKGDMSLVGTRGSLQTSIDAKQHHVPQKHGLTGLWHVRDFDRTLDEAGLEKLDNEYAERWNLMLDVRILLLTPIIHLIHHIIGQEAEEDVRGT